MGLIHEFNVLHCPVQPSDQQVQASSLFDEPQELMRRALLMAVRDYPGKRYNGYTYEIVTDGAGIRHHNLTVYMTDNSPTLDPRNLNGAEQAAMGQYLSEDELARLGIGSRDTR